MNINRISTSITQQTGLPQRTSGNPAINTRDQVVLSSEKEDKQIQGMEALRRPTGSVSDSPEKKELTIMFYMNGEYEDVGPAIQESLFELKRAGSDENVNILAQIGFTPKKPDADSLQTRYDVKRYVITPDNKEHENNFIKDRMNPDKIASFNSDISITKPETLEDFIASGMTKYPANHYMLVFMGHGGAWKGALDMTPDQMSKAVKSALARASKETGKDEKIDVTLFNSCLMANVEALSQMKETSDITIASEDVARGGIFKFWDEVLGDVKEGIKRGDTFDSEKFAHGFVELYRSFQTEQLDPNLDSVITNILDEKKNKEVTDSLNKKLSYTTLTAVDNRKLKGVEDSFRKFVKTLRDEKVPPRKFFKSISEAPDFKGFGDAVGGKYHYSANLRDLGHIMNIVKGSRWSNLKVKKAAADVLKSIGESVINEQHEGKEGEYHGMTMFAPTSAGAVVSDNEKYRSNVGEFAEKTGWADYLMESAETTPQWAREQVKQADLPKLVKLGFEAADGKTQLDKGIIAKNANDYRKKYETAKKRELEHISSEPLIDSDPYRLYQEEIQDWRSFLVSLKESRSPAEKKILGLLDESSRAYIDNWNKNKPVSDAAMKVITADLNRLLTGRELANVAAFMKESGSADKLSKATRDYLEIGVENLEPENLKALNRNFIQDLYPSGVSAISGENPDAFHTDEVFDMYAFLGSLTDKSSPAKEHLVECLDDDCRAAIQAFKTNEYFESKDVQTMVTGLNRLLKNREFPEREIFMKDVGLRRYMNDRTVDLLNRKPKDLSERDLKYLNRSLLSCMFPSGVGYYRWNLESTAKNFKESQEKLEKALEGQSHKEEFEMKLQLADTLAPYLDMTKKHK